MNSFRFQELLCLIFVFSHTFFCSSSFHWFNFNSMYIVIDLENEMWSSFHLLMCSYQACCLFLILLYSLCRHASVCASEAVMVCALILQVYYLSLSLNYQTLIETERKRFTGWLKPDDRTKRKQPPFLSLLLIRLQWKLHWEFMLHFLLLQPHQVTSFMILKQLSLKIIV